MAKALFDASSVSRANLLEAAPIVPGATVSKALLETPHGKLVLFAMDAGQAISEHRAPFVATVHVLDGQLSFGVGAERHVLRAHDWLAMPPNATHDLTAEEPTRFLLTLHK
ncbi:MAG: cupin domain-containing protein [Planctomycetes bacterium]|nr:cupin domain-containing protein [Planctomycetota bacterium]